MESFVLKILKGENQKNNVLTKPSVLICRDIDGHKYRTVFK